MRLKDLSSTGDGVGTVRALLFPVNRQLLQGSGSPSVRAANEPLGRRCLPDWLLELPLLGQWLSQFSVMLAGTGQPIGTASAPDH